MRHIKIHHKNDWFYEFRPYLMLAIGFIGLVHGSPVPSMTWFAHLGQVSGIVLLGLAVLIFQWRRSYRKYR